MATNYALHSHVGAAHTQGTAGQQEVTCPVGRDFNDWSTLLGTRPGP